MSQTLLLKRSNLLNNDGTVKLPTTSNLSYGELAMNYNDGHETLSFRNSNDEIITFSPDADVDTMTVPPNSATKIGSNGKPYKIGDKIRVIKSNNDIVFYSLFNQDNDSNKWVLTEYESSNNGSYPDGFAEIKVKMTPNTGSTVVLSGLTVSLYQYYPSSSEYGKIGSVVYDGYNDPVFYVVPGGTYRVDATSNNSFLNSTASGNTTIDLSYGDKKEIVLAYKGCEINVNVSGYPTSGETPYVNFYYRSVYDVNLKCYGSGKIYCLQKSAVTVTAQEIEGYYYELDTTFLNLTSNTSVTVNCVYRKSETYYIDIDENISDPYTRITSGGTRSVIEDLRGLIHRYAKKSIWDSASNSYRIRLCRVSDSDYRYFEEDGSEIPSYMKSNIYVRIPSFYIKKETISTNKYRFTISLSKLTGAHKTSECYISAFKSYDRHRYDELYSSESEYSVCNYYNYSIILMLYMLYYCNTDSQGTLGSGLNVSAVSGQWVSMNDTNTNSNSIYYGNTSKGINFLGVENLWDNHSEFIGSFNTRIIGYLKNFDFNTSYNFQLIPKTTKGSDSTYYCDYIDITEYEDPESPDSFYLATTGGYNDSRNGIFSMYWASDAHSCCYRYYLNLSNIVGIVSKEDFLN